MTRSRSAPLLPLVACLLLQGCGLFSDEGKNLDRAEVALTRGDYNEAMILLHGVLEKSPGNARAQLLAARGATMLGDFTAADKALAAAEKAGGADTRRARAELLLRGGEAEQLLAWLDQQTPAPDPAWATPLRVRALVGLRRCDEAIPLARSVPADADESARVGVAECYARGGNVARALRELRAATEAAPDAAEAWLAMGRVLQVTGDAPGAEQAWNEAAKHAAGKLAIPQQSLLFSALADLQSERGDLEALRATHRRLVEVVPAAPMTELLAARIAMLEGKYDEGIATLRRLVTKSDDLPAAHTLLLAAHAGQGNLEQARQELGWLERKIGQPRSIESVRGMLDALSRTRPDTVDHALVLANIQGRLGLVDLSGATLDRAAGSSQSNSALQLARAQWQLRTQRIEEALQTLTRLAAAADAGPGVWRLQAEALAAAGRFADADAVLARLWGRAPDASLALMQFGVRLRGKLPDARAPLERWLASNPRDAGIRAAYADSLREIGDHRGAIAQYEILAAANPDSASLLNNLAWLYVLEGNSKAVPAARRAAELAPNSAAIADTYGWALLRAGSPREALPLLRAADEEAGITQPVTRYHLAAALAQTGDAAGARALLEPLLAEDEKFPDREEAARLLAKLRDSQANVTQ